jgi:hypothetical protein
MMKASRIGRSARRDVLLGADPAVRLTRRAQDRLVEMRDEDSASSAGRSI